ncbi:hypothetical protein CYLTODRAFT_177326 [Cylindrobasidium torrendii FP15055 ss-10]|uniref:Uncharacterized protein n=1 Tax=Cylindrobasidium torrendii FP15055 ss-10 TaxID=1314674 RepID=A0A0D7AW51_9AGAR|nr:hypothetical protein CYLTODRAFT_177326 [Cylindrobasidium torrendii FP15055 ss-10]
METQVIRVLEVIIDSDSDCIIIQTSRRDVSTCLLVLLPLYRKYGWEDLPLSLVLHEPRLRYLSALLDLTSAFVSFEEAPLRVVAAADALAKSSYKKLPPPNRSWLQAECAARLVYLRALLQTPSDEDANIAAETKLAAKQLEDVYYRVQETAIKKPVASEYNDEIPSSSKSKAPVGATSSEGLSDYLSHAGTIPSTESPSMAPSSGARTDSVAPRWSNITQELERSRAGGASSATIVPRSSIAPSSGGRPQSLSSRWSNLMGEPDRGRAGSTSSAAIASHSGIAPSSRVEPRSTSSNLKRELDRGRAGSTSSTIIAPTMAEASSASVTASKPLPVPSKPESIPPPPTNQPLPYRKGKYVRRAVLLKTKGLPYLRKRLEIALRCEEAYPNIVNSRAGWPNMPREFWNDALEALRKIKAPSPPATGQRDNGKRSAQSEGDGEIAAKRLKTENGELPADGFLIEKSRSYVVAGTDNVLEELTHFHKKGAWKTSPIIAVVWLAGYVPGPFQEAFSIIPHLVSGLEGVKLVVLPQTGTWRTLAPPQAMFDPFQGPVFALKASTKVDLTDMEELLARIPGRDSKASRVTLPTTKTLPTPADPSRRKTVPLPLASSSRKALSDTTPATNTSNIKMPALAFPPPPPTSTPPPLPQIPSPSIARALASAASTLPQRPPPALSDWWTRRP